MQFCAKLILMSKKWMLGAIIGLSTTAAAQTVTQDTSTASTTFLPEITLVGKGSKSDYQQLPEIVGTNIYAGKKNALIVIENVQGNVVTNNMRQVLAKVAGVHIWESDPSGIQIGIAARGLSPNRSWEFNTRQNGYDIAADPFGYPEAYYNPQLQAVQRIEIVRGQGALQYGPQFGGLVNYILRNGSEFKKKVEFETQQSFGSKNMFNSFNAIGGKTKKLHYYSFFDHRSGNGYRANSKYFTNSGYGSLTYNINNKLALTAEVMHSHMRSQQPGGLTDVQLQENITQSFRSRNWFDITWTTPALILNYTLSANTKWNTKVFGTIGDRNSVGFLQPITTKDSINKATNDYNNRQLQIDKYRNYGMESRFITNYNLAGIKNTISTGIRLYTGTTTRLSNGVGTTGADYDMTLVGKYSGDIAFTTFNAAAFAENIIHVGKKLLLIPGVRYEWLKGTANGRNGFTSTGADIILQDVERSRGFLLAAFGAEYHVTKTTEVYASYAQAFRPIQFANLQAAPTTDVIDTDLKDAKGYNVDLGYRGKWSNFLQFDVSAFYLQYNNRIGTVTVTGTPNYRFVTNVGSSTSKGVESFVEWNITNSLNRLSNKYHASIFTSYAYNDAKYNAEHKDANTKGKKLENAPANIVRTGLSLGYNKFLLTTQLSHVGKAFSDANNTALPSANGNTGVIPAYSVVDITAAYKLNDNINVKAGLNNLANTKYFTRRSGGYPGPGALPADGRTFFVTFAAKF
jgi:Fe(3+) dicitrate transport protein